MTDFEKQLIVLKHLEGKTWTQKLPPQMSLDEYVHICKMLKEDFYVEYRVISYGNACAANITGNGKYRIYEMETKLHDHLATNTDLLEDEITIWIRLAERAENIHEGIDHFAFNEILTDLSKKGYVRHPICPGSIYELSVQGTKQWNTMIKGFGTSTNNQDNSVENVQNFNMPFVTLNKKRGNRINLIRIVWALWNLGYFLDEDGKKSNIKDVFTVIGNAINFELDDNGSSFSQSNKADTTRPIHNLIAKLKEGEQEFNNFLEEICNTLLEENTKKM